MPTDTQLNDLRSFIQKYYKDEIYINIFDTAVSNNKIANENFIKYGDSYKEKLFGKSWI